jgi:hypothetical protein
MATRCTCGAGHETFGACIRAKNLKVGYCRSHLADKNPARYDRTANRWHERELEEYAKARKQGIKPGGTTMPAIRHALDRSDALGRPYDAANPLAGVDLSA